MRGEPCRVTLSLGTTSMLRCDMEVSPPCNRKQRHHGAEKAGGSMTDASREHTPQEARTVILGGERGLGTVSIWSECSGLGMHAFLA